MKMYAVIDGVCGITEGYSETQVKWFKTIDEAINYKSRLLKDFVPDYDSVESVESSTDGMQDIIVWDERDSRQSILKIIPVRPIFDKLKVRAEYLIWDQLACDAVARGYFLPSDIDAIRYALEHFESMSMDKFDIDSFHEFIHDLSLGGDAMLDADDVVRYYLRVPKSKEFTS
jgi:hypothetical protein